MKVAWHLLTQAAPQAQNWAATMGEKAKSVVKSGAPYARDVASIVAKEALFMLSSTVGLAGNWCKNMWERWYIPDGKHLLEATNGTKYMHPKYSPEQNRVTRNENRCNIVLGIIGLLSWQMALWDHSLGYFSLSIACLWANRRYSQWLNEPLEAIKSQAQIDIEVFARNAAGGGKKEQ